MSRILRMLSWCASSSGPTIGWRSPRCCGSRILALLSWVGSRPHRRTATLFRITTSRNTRRQLWRWSKAHGLSTVLGLTSWDGWRTTRRGSLPSRRRSPSSSRSPLLCGLRRSLSSGATTRRCRLSPSRSGLRAVAAWRGSGRAKSQRVALLPPCLPTMMVVRSLPNHSTKLIAKDRSQWRRPGQGCALRQGLARRQRPHFLQCQRCLLCLLQCRLLQGRQPRKPWA